MIKKRRIFLAGRSAFCHYRKQVNPNVRLDRVLCRDSRVQSSFCVRQPPTSSRTTVKTLTMASTEHRQLDQLPDEMFSIIKSTSHHLTPRLGSLTLPGRNAIQTPHYLGLTSRGMIPHISQDNFAQLAAVTGVYAALEDCAYHLAFELCANALTHILIVD